MSSATGAGTGMDGGLGGKMALVAGGEGKVGRAAVFLASPGGAFPFLRGAAIAPKRMSLERPAAVASVQAHRRGAPA